MLKYLNVVSKSHLKFSLFVIAALSTVAYTADAQAYGRRYYTAHEVRECRNQGGNAVFGAVAGAAGGFLFGAATGLNRGASAAVGGVAGGLLGAGLSCQDETVYLERVDWHLSDRSYSRPYVDPNMRVTVLRSGRNPEGFVCRTYLTEYRTRRGWIEKEETACWVRGMWRHGYMGEIIRDVRYHRPRPQRIDYVEVEPIYERRYLRPVYRDYRDHSHFERRYVR